jgi:UDP:flavonoid glycosyltransferase YjiC (YdhE family)
MKKSLTIVCDAVLSDFGPLRPAILIAKQFAKKGHNVKILSTIITEEEYEAYEGLCEECHEIEIDELDYEDDDY